MYIVAGFWRQCKLFIFKNVDVIGKLFIFKTSTLWKFGTRIGNRLGTQLVKLFACCVNFHVLMSAVFSSSELKAHSAQAIGIVGCLSCVVPHVANNFFKGHLPKLKSTFWPNLTEMIHIDLGMAIDSAPPWGFGDYDFLILLYKHMSKENSPHFRWSYLWPIESCAKLCYL